MELNFWSTFWKIIWWNRKSTYKNW